MGGIETADATAVPFDPFELKDVVSGNIGDPYPAHAGAAASVPGPPG